MSVIIEVTAALAMGRVGVSIATSGVGVTIVTAVGIYKEGIMSEHIRMHNHTIVAESATMYSYQISGYCMVATN